MQAVICFGYSALLFFSLSSFSCYFGILKGWVFFFKHLHLCVPAGSSWARSWDTLYPAVFSLRKNGPHTKAVLASHPDSCMWEAIVAQVTCMSVYNYKVGVNLPGHAFGFALSAACFCCKVGQA